MIKESRAYKYAVQCVNDNTGKVGRYVKKQCEQWLETADGTMYNLIKFQKNQVLRGETRKGI